VARATPLNPNQAKTRGTGIGIRSVSCDIAIPQSSTRFSGNLRYPGVKLFFACAMFLDLATTGPGSTSSAGTPFQAPGTRRMAERLQQLIREVGPQKNPYSGRARADWARGRMAEAPDPEEQLNLHLMLGHESLQAGDPQSQQPKSDVIDPLVLGKPPPTRL